MRARNALRLLLIVLAGTLALPLVASVVALRGPATVSRAADGDPTVIATISVGDHPCGVALNPNSNRIYVPNFADDTVSVIEDIVPPTPVPSTPTAHPGVGGKVLLPPAAMATESRASTEDSGWSAGAYSALAVVGTAVAVAGGAWYARRRWRAG